MDILLIRKSIAVKTQIPASASNCRRSQFLRWAAVLTQNTGDNAKAVVNERRMYKVVLAARP
jgi:hypothetical protein